MPNVKGSTLSKANVDTTNLLRGKISLLVGSFNRFGEVRKQSLLWSNNESIHNSPYPKFIQLDVLFTNIAVMRLLYIKTVFSRMSTKLLVIYCSNKCIHLPTPS